MWKFAPTSWLCLSMGYSLCPLVVMFAAARSEAGGPGPAPGVVQIPTPAADRQAGVVALGGTNASPVGLEVADVFTEGYAVLPSQPFVPPEQEFDRWVYVRRAMRKVAATDYAVKRWLVGKIVGDGCGGEGCPAVGQYHLMYAENPGYFDRRDGVVFGAEGYGAPVGVPLASPIDHTWNYSAGTPASRLTPVSTPIPY